MDPSEAHGQTANLHDIKERHELTSASCLYLGKDPDVGRQLTVINNEQIITFEIFPTDSGIVLRFESGLNLTCSHDEILCLPSEDDPWILLQPDRKILFIHASPDVEIKYPYIEDKIDDDVEDVLDETQRGRMVIANLFAELQFDCDDAARKQAARTAEAEHSFRERTKRDLAAGNPVGLTKVAKVNDEFTVPIARFLDNCELLDDCEGYRYALMIHECYGFAIIDDVLVHFAEISPDPNVMSSCNVVPVNKPFKIQGTWDCCFDGTILTVRRKGQVIPVKATRISVKTIDGARQDFKELRKALAKDLTKTTLMGGIFARLFGWQRDDV